MDPSGHSPASVVAGTVGTILSFAGWVSTRKVVVLLSIGTGVAQILIATYDYNKAKKSLKRLYGTGSLRHKNSMKVNDFMMKLSTISTGVSVILNCIGLKYSRKLSVQVVCAIADFGIARSINMFGVVYDVAVLLANPKKIKFKSE